RRPSAAPERPLPSAWRGHESGIRHGGHAERRASPRRPDAGARPVLRIPGSDDAEIRRRGRYQGSQESDWSDAVFRSLERPSRNGDRSTGVAIIAREESVKILHGPKGGEVLDATLTMYPS